MTYDDDVDYIDNDAWGYASVGSKRNTKGTTTEVPYSTWAPKMWKDFDNLAANFNQATFATQVHSMISNIPCPKCKTDGETYVKTNPPESVKSKTEAQNWVKQYHSHVDKVAGGWGVVRTLVPWYSVMWEDLHETASSFNPYIFAPKVREQINQIPESSWKESSILFAQTYPPEYVQTREQAMYWMCRFHNRASYDAGNGLVDCDTDIDGYGYISGHREMGDFFYSKGGGSKGGSRGGKGRRGGQQQQDDGSGQDMGGQQHHHRRMGGRG